MVRVSVRSSKDGYLRNVAVIDLQCAGLEVDIESVRNSNSMWQPDYIDIREDRIVLYGTVTDKINNFTYKAKAITSGKFVVPRLFTAYSHRQTVILKPVCLIRRDTCHSTAQEMKY